MRRKEEDACSARAASRKKIVIINNQHMLRRLHFGLSRQGGSTISAGNNLIVIR